MLLAQIIVLIGSRVVLPSWVLQALLTLAPQIEAQIPKEKLLALAKTLGSEAFAKIGPFAGEVAKAAVVWLEKQPHVESGPADYGGNAPAGYDDQKGFAPQGDAGEPQKPMKPEDFQP